MYHAHTVNKLLLCVLVPHSARMSIPHLALNITVWVWLRDHDLLPVEQQYTWSILYLS